MSVASVPQAFVHWEATLGDLFAKTSKFPKSARFTFAVRMDNLALDVIEDLVEARYARRDRQAEVLARLDGRLARLRVLIRLSFGQRYLDKRGYEHLQRQTDELGRMVGGWRKAVTR